MSGSSVDPQDVFGRAAQLAARRYSNGAGKTHALGQLVPILIDQVMAEAGVVEPQLAGQAMEQAYGDIVRAASLLRSWVSTLPRLGQSVADWSEIDIERRITPAYTRPPGGQYLGASLDFQPRLLNLSPRVRQPGDRHTASATGDQSQSDSQGQHESEPDVHDGEPRFELQRVTRGLEEAGLIYPTTAPTKATDRTRVTSTAGDRGAFLQFLAQAETGALTALAYAATWGDGTNGQADPTLMELRAGHLPISVRHPRTGKPVHVGNITITACEVVLFRVGHDESGEHVDSRFTLGIGVTVGVLEKRAIAAGILDACVTRTRATPPPGPLAPYNSEEWLLAMCDGFGTTGLVEHFKLPHHVTFTADLERVTTFKTSESAV